MWLKVIARRSWTEAGRAVVKVLSGMAVHEVTAAPSEPKEPTEPRARRKGSTRRTAVSPEHERRRNHV